MSGPSGGSSPAVAGQQPELPVQQSSGFAAHSLMARAATMRGIPALVGHPNSSRKEISGQLKVGHARLSGQLRSLIWHCPVVPVASSLFIARFSVPGSQTLCVDAFE
jgi:hypothetical protein